MQLLLDHHASPLGTLLLVTDTQGRLRALDYEDYAERMHRLLARRCPAADLASGCASDAVHAGLEDYFTGQLDALARLPIAPDGTAFQQRVWDALREIPAGQTMSYGALAARLDKPTASRAVGLANGSNPLAIVVPCHRVIAADGKLGGYAGGLWRKERLLTHERAAVAGLCSR